MPSASDMRLLAPFVITGEAVDRDRNVRDHNNAAKTDQQEWLESARAANHEISELENKFLDELKNRAQVVV